MESFLLPVATRGNQNCMSLHGHAVTYYSSIHQTAGRSLHVCPVLDTLGTNRAKHLCPPLSKRGGTPCHNGVQDVFGSRWILSTGAGRSTAHKGGTCVLHCMPRPSPKGKKSTNIKTNAGLAHQRCKNQGSQQPRRSAASLSGSGAGH